MKNSKICIGINEEEKLNKNLVIMIKIRYTLVMLLMFLISIGFIGWAIVMLSGVASAKSVKTTVSVSVPENFCNTCIANINPYHYKRNMFQTRFCEWICERYK